MWAGQATQCHAQALKRADLNRLAWTIVDEATDGNKDPLDLGLQRCECLAIGTVADHGPHGVHRMPRVKRSPAPGPFISSQGVRLFDPTVDPTWLDFGRRPWTATSLFELAIDPGRPLWTPPCGSEKPGVGGSIPPLGTSF